MIEMLWLALFIQFMFVVHTLSKHSVEIMDLGFENTKLKIRLSHLEKKDIEI